MASQEESQIFVPQGITKQYEALHGENSSHNLEDHVRSIVELYQSNGMQAFWTPSDIVVLHVILSNQLLSREDSDCAIDDVSTFENVFARLETLFTSWVTEKKRQVFNSSIIDEMSMSDKNKVALVNGLRAALFFISSDQEPGENATTDDQALYCIVQAVMAKEPKPGWALKRLTLVLETLTKTPTNAAINDPVEKQDEIGKDQETEPEPVSDVELIRSGSLSLSDLMQR
jgi:hypothetical protein